VQWFTGMLTLAVHPEPVERRVFLNWFRLYGSTSSPRTVGEKFISCYTSTLSVR